MPSSKPAPIELHATIPVPVARSLDLRLVITAAVLVVVLGTLAWFKPWTPRPALDRFWAPVLDSSSTVLLCVGQRHFLGSSPENAQQSVRDLPQPDSPAAITLFKLYYLGSQNVAFHDVTTLARLTGLLEAKGKRYHLRGENSTSFADLRDGPVVLVGALDNDWTMRLTGAMRFSFERENDIFWIKDQRNPANRDRAVNYSVPYLGLTEDYAIITRVLEPTTERMVVVAGGLTGFGTMAAGEFLTDPAYLKTAAKQLPANWEHRNIQLVISTKVINGNSGPPKVVDQFIW